MTMPVTVYHLCTQFWDLEGYNMASGMPTLLCGLTCWVQLVFYFYLQAEANYRLASVLPYQVIRPIKN